MIRSEIKKWATCQPAWRTHQLVRGMDLTGVLDEDEIASLLFLERSRVLEALRGCLCDVGRAS
jgi:hypothetical protein